MRVSRGKRLARRGILDEGVKLSGYVDLTRLPLFNKRKRVLFKWFQLVFLVCFVFCTLQFQQGCSEPGTCVNGINSLRIDPKDSTCKSDCDCNNQLYTGHCSGGLCKSWPRASCEVIGLKQQCISPINDCRGVHVCQPEPLKSKFWGDCICDSGESAVERLSEGVTQREKNVPEEHFVDAAIVPEKPNEREPKPPEISESQQERFQEQAFEKGFPEQSEEQSPEKQLPELLPENRPCSNGQKRSCYTGVSSTRGIGVCKDGSQTCTGGAWGACSGEILPAKTDSCGNQKDDNCNGFTDEGCKGWLTSFGGIGAESAGAILHTAKGIFVAGSFAKSYKVNVNKQSKTLSSKGNADIFVKKLNSDGTVAWTLTGGTPFVDGAHCLATDGKGALYVSGTVGGTSFCQNDTECKTATFSGTCDQKISCKYDAKVFQQAVTLGTVTTKQKVTYRKQQGFIARLDAQKGTVSWITLLGTREPGTKNCMVVNKKGTLFVALKFSTPTFGLVATLDSSGKLGPVVTGSQVSLGSTISATSLAYDKTKDVVFFGGPVAGEIRLGSSTVKSSSTQHHEVYIAKLEGTSTTPKVLIQTKSSQGTEVILEGLSFVPGKNQLAVLGGFGTRTDFCQKDADCQYGAKGKCSNGFCDFGKRSLTLDKTISHQGGSALFLARLQLAPSVKALELHSFGSLGNCDGASLASDAAGNLYMYGVYDGEMTFGSVKLPVPQGRLSQLFVGMLTSTGKSWVLVVPVLSTPRGQLIVEEGKTPNIYIIGEYEFASPTAVGNHTLPASRAYDVFAWKIEAPKP